MDKEKDQSNKVTTSTNIFRADHPASDSCGVVIGVMMMVYNGIPGYRIGFSSAK